MHLEPTTWLPRVFVAYRNAADRTDLGTRQLVALIPARSTRSTQHSGRPGDGTFGVVSDVVRIELGVSILQDELIAREAAAVGLRVQLLRNGHPEMGAGFALATCALLVAADHEVEVRQLIATHGY